MSGRTGAAARVSVMRNFFSLAVGEGLSKLLGLLTTVYLARALGPDHFGIIGFAIAFVGYFTLLGGQGLEWFATREVARHPGRLPDLVNNVVTFRLGVASVATAAYVAAVVFLLPHSPVAKAVLLVVGLNVLLGALLLRWVYQGLERMHVVAAALVAGSLCNLGGVLLFVRGPENVVMAAWAAVASAAVNVSVLGGAYRKSGGRFRATVDRRLWKRMVREATPMALSSALLGFYYGFGIVLLGFVSSSAEVGYYNAAYRLVLALHAIQFWLNRSIYPVLSRLWHSGSVDRTRRLVQSLMQLMAVVSTAMVLSVVGFGKEIVLGLYGPSYHPSILPLQVLVFTMALVYNEAVSGPLLYATGGEGKYLRAVALAALVTVLLGPWLVPTYGALGAALLLVASEVAVFGLFLMHSRSLLPLKLWRIFSRPALSGAVCLVGISMLSESWGKLLVLVAFCAVNYRHDMAQELVRQLRQA